MRRSHPFRSAGTVLPVLAMITAMLAFAACSKSPAADSQTTTHPPPATAGGVTTTAFSAQQLQDVQTNWLYYGLINDENYYYFLYMGFQLLEADSILTIGVTPNIPNAVLCGAKIRLDSNATDRMMIITYNGNACPINDHDTGDLGPMHVTATGTVVVSSPLRQEWDDTSTVKTDIRHLVIDVPGNRMTVDGVITTKNLTGGNPVLLHSGSSPIVQTVKSDVMTGTFRDGSTDKWQLDMKRIYSYNNGIVITTTGVHANDSASNIAQWGVDRGNHPFVTQITTPIVNEQSCGMHVTAGEVNQSTFIDQPGFPYYMSFIFTMGKDPYTGHEGCPLPGEESYLLTRMIEPGFNGNGIWKY